MVTLVAPDDDRVIGVGIKPMGKTHDERGALTERGREARTGTAPWVCGFVLAALADGKRIACAAPAKTSHLGPRCADHYPKAVS